MRNFIGLILILLAVDARHVSAQAPPYSTVDTLVSANNVVLSTRLYAPVGRDRYPIVVLIAGSGDISTIGSDYTKHHATAFVGRGIGVLAYDKRGTGASKGAYTGSDFKTLAADAAGIVRYAQRLPQCTDVGIWGLSQSGWIIPYTLERTRGPAFVIMVSPAGINPFDQVAYFLHQQALGWGLSPEEAKAADRMHRDVALYYAGRESYETAQASVDAHRNAPWFHRVVTHPYWDEMPEGRILNPTELATALRKRPGAFEVYRSPSSFVDYAPLYRSLRRLATLVIHGGDDQLVPPGQSRPIFEAALRDERRYAHDFLLFEGAGHGITMPGDQVRSDYLEAMVSWAERQFGQGQVGSRH